MFATSLGPDDACFVAGANWQKNSGLMCVWGQVCAVQKEFIEASKTDECAYGCPDQDGSRIILGDESNELGTQGGGSPKS